MARPKGNSLVQDIIDGSVEGELLKDMPEATDDKKKKKYAVNVIFDGELEAQIKTAAKSKGLGVATYIKLLVNEDLRK